MKQATTEIRKKRPGRAPAPTEAPPSGEPGILIRAAERRDVAEVTALDAQVTGLPKPEHWMELYRRQRPSGGAPAGIFLVAAAPAEPERVLGFIVGEIRAWEFGSDPCGWVYALSVRPDARERGVGEALLEAIAEAFRKTGVGKMRTMVARDAILPMQFFRGEGLMAGPYIQLEKDL